MGSGSGLGQQRPPDRCKRRMNSHIVTALSPSRSFCTNPSPHTHASSGWGEAPLSIQQASESCRWLRGSRGKVAVSCRGRCPDTRGGRVGAVPADPALPTAEELAALPHEELAARLADAYRLISELSARVERLEKRLAKDSSTSSKPPSSDSPYGKASAGSAVRAWPARTSSRSAATRSPTSCPRLLPRSPSMSRSRRGARAAGRSPRGNCRPGSGPVPASARRPMRRQRT
jgi:hypothetical protein